jgi:uncharacterized membrane protein YraQ (UPF0718 family)
MYYVAGLLWGGLFFVLGRAWLRGDERVVRVFRSARKSARIFYGVVPMALIAAGFFGPMVQGDLVARWLGDAAGATGILIAMVAGWCLPVPPVIFFPLVAVLLKSGAGIPQMVALVAAWNVFAIHRTLAMELPVMGRYFVSLRLVSSLVIPPVAGLLSWHVVDLWRALAGG